ncbi:hypothetical protein RXV95_01590 [Novosphingobium sp. ZN18A2]|uniref:hypothetical protein n=1 Tax=Novosphingobium sp. ZN18A2 TaxID=3079861 RepID=UPI0030D384DE
MTKLDISAAWTSATRMVSANRDMLMAIAGVFFLLPGLAVAVFMGDPDIASNVDPKQAMTILAETYLSAAPLLIFVSLLQLTGTLIVLIVMIDPSRPTVAEAIKRGFVATPPYFGAQVLVYVVGGFTMLALASLLAATGVAVLAAAALVALFVAMVWVLLRVSLVAPVLASSETRNPVTAIKRSWSLTTGNSPYLLAFYGLSALLFFVVYGLIMMFAGVVLALTTSGSVQTVLAAVVSSALFSAWLVYFAAMTAAVHRQLSGPPSGETREVFE